MKHARQNYENSKSPFALKRATSFFLLTAWVALFCLGIKNYPGSEHIYCFFSFTFLALLLSGLYSKTSYSYTFLTIMIWLGFWLKTTIHLIFSYEYVEPIGYFIGSSGEWDEVLRVASLGAIGAIIARWIFHLSSSNFTTLAISTPPPPPSWYNQYKIHIWVTLTLSVIALCLANIYFSFHQIGIVPKTIIWPLNAIFSWLISTGFAMTTVTLLWWEFSNKNSNIYCICLALFEATFSSISLLSRGLYIFHIIPLFMAAILNRKLFRNLNFKSSILILTLTFALYLMTFPLVNSIRNYHYSGIRHEISIDFGSDYLTKGLLKLSRFAVDRWIGVEGLMATTAYKEKNFALFLSSATEKVEIGKVTTFQTIANSDYRFADSKKFLFASLPGPISLMYLSGSLILVILGMFSITLIMLFSELVIHRLLSNPFLTALWASITSTAVAQLGINIPGLIFYLLLCTTGISAIYLLQNASHLIKKHPIQRKP